MKNASPKVDQYIADAPEFARPILTRIRKLYHKACPQVEETIKWGFPVFVYKGMLGSMAAFKEHVSFGFWKGQLLDDPDGLFSDAGKTKMKMRKVADVSELPPDKVLLSFIRQAVQLNETGVKKPAPRVKAKKGELEVPGDFRAAIGKNRKARAIFEGFSYSNKREYIEWVTEAKRAATRQKRIETAVEWLAEGKPRNWKYMKGY